VSYKKQELRTLREHLSSSLVLWRVPCCLSLYFFCVVLLCVFPFWVPLCNVPCGTSLPPVVCRNAHVLFTLFVFACAEWYPTHIVLCFCFVVLRVVCPMLPVSLDCPFLIVHSVFSNVYLIYLPFSASCWHKSVQSLSVIFFVIMSVNLILLHAPITDIYLLKCTFFVFIIEGVSYLSVLIV
jgi:hypothetical protein